MPEGDTLLRTARTLDRRLAGKALTGVRGPGLDGRGLAGRTVVRVEAHGKHVIVILDDRRAIRSHLGMHGSWHVYKPGEKWWQPAHLAKCVLETESAVAVCFQPRAVELLPSVEASAVLQRLGPDVLAPDFDAARAVANLRAQGARPIGDAVLDQELVAGIGNIWKSESLFATRANPFLGVDAFSDDQLLAILDAARRAMTLSVYGDARPRFAVYDRSGKPCPRCGEAIAMKRQGALHRSTYYCPSCQGTPP